MLQNSLARLFDGMAATLHGRVLPALEDPAVAAQVRALIELLGNLSTRVCWDVAYLDELRRRARPALIAVAGVDGAPAAVAATLARPPAPLADPDALREEVVEVLDALTAAQAWLEEVDAELPEARAAVTAFADFYLEQEMSRLRSASFGRPAEEGAR